MARRCDPPTTAQTIGRLETGTRTVSIAWLNRIATALGVEAANLVTLPDRVDLPVVAILDDRGVHAPRRTIALPPPQVAPGQIAVTVAGGIGDYRAGDAIWCEMVAPEAFATALNRDVLVPQPAGRFVFGRLFRVEANALTLLQPGPKTPASTIENPAWIAIAVRLIREL